jgi:oxygen-independent coproporphyrinogen III oxidase
MYEICQSANALQHVVCAQNAVKELGFPDAPDNYELVFNYPPLRVLQAWDNRNEPEMLRRAEKAGSTSMYIHIPFCSGKCTYCHYLTLRTSRSADVVEYLKLVELELDIWRRHLGVERIHVSSLHVGGGTPTFLSPAELGGFCELVAERCNFAKDYQWTFEAAPETVTAEKLQLLRDFGVNRISIGVETTDDNLLKTLHRRHSSEEAIRAIETAQESGIPELNVDLMYGLPAQDITGWLESLCQLLLFRPSSFSLYRLRIRSETPFGQSYRNSGQYILNTVPNTIAAIEWREVARQLLEHQGYRGDPVERFHDKQVRGNLYQRETWQERKQCLAIGPSGYWRIGGAVGVNYRNLRMYEVSIKAGKLPFESGHVLGVIEECVGAFVPGLKFLGGVDLKSALQSANLEARDLVITAIKKLENFGLATVEPERVTLTQAGKLVADELLPMFYQHQHKLQLSSWQNDFGQYS